MNPLKQGADMSMVRNNVREMIKSGKKPKEAVAAALSMKRKTTKMSDGGIVSDDMDEDVSSDFDENASRGLTELQSQGESHPNDVMNPEYQEADRMLAKALYEQSEKHEMGYAMGGLVQPDYGMDLGNKPSEDMSDTSMEDMSSGLDKPDRLEHAMVDGATQVGGLSDDAMKALAEKKKKRRFV